MMISLRRRASPPRGQKISDCPDYGTKKSTLFQQTTSHGDATDTVPKAFLDQLRLHEDTIIKLKATHESDQRAMKQLRQEIETMSVQNEKAMGHEETIMALQTQRACDQQLMQSMRDELDALRLEQENGKEWQRITVEQARREAEMAKEQLASMEENFLRWDLSHNMKLIEEDAPDNDKLDLVYVTKLQSHLCRALRITQIQHAQIADLKSTRERLASALQHEIECFLSNSMKTKAGLLDQIADLEEGKKNMQRHYEQKVEQRDRVILDLKGAVDFAEKDDHMQSERRHRHFMAIQKEMDQNRREKHILTTEINSKNIQIAHLEMVVKKKDRIISQMERDASSGTDKLTDVMNGPREPQHVYEDSLSSPSSSSSECDPVSKLISTSGNDSSCRSLEKLECNNDKDEQSCCSTDDESESQQSESSASSSSFEESSAHSSLMMEDSFSFHPVNYRFVFTSDQDNHEQDDEEQPVKEAIEEEEQQEDAVTREQQNRVTTTSCSNKKAGALVDSFTSVFDYTKLMQKGKLTEAQ